MKKLLINEGLEKFMINDDPERVICFNTADIEILARVAALEKEFKNYQPDESLELNPDGSPKSELEKSAAFIAEFSKAMRKAFNEVFNADVYDIIFNGQSPLCIVGAKGKEKYLFEEVIDALIALMKPAFEAYGEKNQKRMKKYLGDI